MLSLILENMQPLTACLKTIISFLQIIHIRVMFMVWHCIIKTCCFVKVPHTTVLGYED